MDALLWQDKVLSLLDQSKYPAEEVWLTCNDAPSVVAALRKPGAVFGEAIIASAGAYGYCLAALQNEGSHEFYKQMTEVKQSLIAARPESAALRAAFSHLDRVYEEYKQSPELITALLAGAVTIHRQTVIACRAMNREGREILPEEAKIVLSSQGSVFHAGVAGGPIGVLRAAAQKHKIKTVFVCENRPGMEGLPIARELASHQIPTTMIPDHTAASLMPRQSCDLVLIEGMRAAANGDLLAPPGSYELAIAAYFHSIPVYATLFCSDVDKSIPNGDAFPREDLSPSELCAFPDQNALPDGISTWSPRYDMLPQYLLTGLISDKGLLFSPYEESIAEALLKIPDKNILFF